MGLHNYLWLVIKTAWKHSLHAAHSIILVLIIIAGLVTHLIPRVIARSIWGTMLARIFFSLFR